MKKAATATTQKRSAIIPKSVDKGSFLLENEIRFSNLQNKLLWITILNLKFEILAHNWKQLI